MKKKLIQLAVVLVLLAGALIAMLALQRDDPVVEETPDETVYVLGGIPQPFVRRVEIRNDKDAFTVENGFENAIQQQNSGETRYTIPGLDQESLNSATLRSVMTTAANLPAQKVVAESGGDLALYGLAEPRATVTVTYDDGETALLVGDESPGGEGTYVAVDGAVYLVDSTKLTNALGTRLDFVSRTVTPGNAETTRFERIELSGGHYPAPIVIERNPEEDDSLSSIYGFSSYRMTSPVQAGADSQTGVTALQSVFGLYASGVAALTAPGEEASYGLDAPYVRIDVTPMGGEEAEPIEPFTLLLSAPNEDGELYAVNSAADYVYTIPAADLAFLELTPFDYMEKMIVTPHIDSVSEILVQAGGETVTFRLSGEGGELSVTADGTPLATDNFRTFYQTLVSARYEAEIPAQDPADTPEREEETGTAENEEEEALLAQLLEEEARADADALLQITYRYRDGSADSVVRFTPGPVRRAAVSLNGGPAYLALSSYVDRVLEDLPKVVAGQQVDSYY